MLKKFALLTLVLLTVDICLPSNASALQLPSKCTTRPCPNTPRGEDPGKLEAREGAKLEDALRGNPNDKERWADIVIYSDATQKKDLEIVIIKSADFRVALNPSSGVLSFSTPSTRQSFKFASPRGTSTDPCGKYQVRVLDASKYYALVKKNCRRWEYRPNRFYRASDYYIYDMLTMTMRSIWRASDSIGIDTPFPDATPKIAITENSSGFDFNWSGINAGDQEKSVQTIHNFYKRETNAKVGNVLVCYDMRVPLHPRKENEMCESDVLDTVPNDKK